MIRYNSLTLTQSPEPEDQVENPSLVLAKRQLMDLLCKRAAQEQISLPELMQSPVWKTFYQHQLMALQASTEAQPSQTHREVP